MYLKQYVLLASTLSLVATSISPAAAVRITQASTAPHRVLVSAEARQTIGRKPLDLPPSPAGCTPVTTSAAIAGDLEEVTTTTTAALVVSTSKTQVTKVNIDATGCDIGIYVAPAAKNVKIEDVSVHGATRAGIVVDGATCTTLLGDTVYNIGDQPQSGDQYGFAVITEGAKNVAVDYVTAYLYQKTGFNIRHSTGSVNFNTVTGDGPIGVPLAALNGFEFLNDNLNAIWENRTSLNQYTGPIYGGAGYLLFCTKVNKHVLGSSSSDQKKFAQTWQNLEAFDDIPYYLDPTDRCNGT